MKTKLILATLCGLLFTLATNAQESPKFSLSFGDKDREYHNVGFGHWNAPAAPEGAPTEGCTVSYASWTFLASADFAGGRPVNVHINPHLHLTASCETPGGFRTEARLYPIAGVSGLSEKDVKFDYGAAIGLTMGWKAGIGGVIRVTRHTKAAGLCLAF